jgi:hypothetical protein
VTIIHGCPPISVAEAAAIGRANDYDQVIIIARKCGPGGGEWVTAWGVDDAHLAAANTAADFLKYKVMRWPVSGVESTANKEFRAEANPGVCNNEEREEDG